MSSLLKELLEESTVIVTGGAGFIGSHIVDRIVDIAFETIVIDNLSSNVVNPEEEWEGKALFINCDLSIPNHRCIQALMSSDIVFHFAANPEVRISTTEPHVHYRNNVLATWNVLQYLKKKPPKILVFASSSTVYGEAKIFPTPETHPLDPISVYGATKVAGEVFATTFSKLYGFKTVVLRYANIVGPKLRHGVIWDFVHKLKNNPSQLEILGDGTQKKSYLYIDDALEATFKAMTHTFESKEQYKVYNIGNTDWITVKEIANIIVDVMGLSNVDYVYKKTTPDGRGWVGDVKFMLLDIKRIMQETGWKPRMTSEDAVRATAKSIVSGLVER